jgi:hypothetical protein
MRGVNRTKFHSKKKGFVYVYLHRRLVPRINRKPRIIEAIPSSYGILIIKAIPSSYHGRILIIEAIPSSYGILIIKAIPSSYGILFDPQKAKWRK